MCKNRQNSLVRWFEGQLFKLGWVNSPECDRWNGLTRSFWLWGFGNIKIQAPGLSPYETRWLWRHLCQQDTGHRSTCRTAQWMSSWAAQKIDHSSNAWTTQCPPFHILVYSILFYSILFYSNVVHFILFVRLNVSECVCVHTHTHRHTHIH
jgi:hypothetical protein